MYNESLPLYINLEREDTFFKLFFYKSNNFCKLAVYEKIPTFYPN